MIYKTEWIKITADDKDYWNRQTEHHRYQLQNTVDTVMKSLNQTEGDHTLQWMFGCGLDNGTVRGYSQYRYDGEDFISLYLNWCQELGCRTWTAANEKAEIFINKWDPKGEKARYWMDYLQFNCIDQLQKFVNHSRETLERKVHSEMSVFQKHSPSPEVMCHATGFFPKAVMISWRKDGEDVHDNVEHRVSLINQDGSFQKRSFLNVSAEDLQKHNYTCVIQHSSLEKELVLNVNKQSNTNGSGSDGGSDEGSGGGSGRGNIGIIVAAVVTLLVLVAVVGVFIWKKRSSGAENPHEVQQNGTEMHPLNTPHSDVKSKPGSKPPH
ncbi:class I histocompatibility antigen, Gogo-B*0103 alpha chain-like isoform X2 [Tachysurus fulvidraco]|nr:class I histocompatibility antigen, Gogo-B*0103 alpha chain-like isoform X2 [Tachysurus fulvidraco]